MIIVVTARVSADPTLAEEDYAATFCGIQNMLLVAASAGIGTYPRTGPRSTVGSSRRLC